MRIAVTYENGQIFQHFGHTEHFKLYNVDKNSVEALGVFPTNGSGHGALADFLTQLGVDVLICGGIGGGAQAALAPAGIALYAGVQGDADAAVNALVSGQLVFATGATCDHHHGEDHSCGSHCGSHDHQGCGGHH